MTNYSLEIFTDHQIVHLKIKKNLNILLKTAVQAAYSHILSTGDFNYKDIDWLTIESKVDIENDTSIFLENIRDLYLTQHVIQPTRFRENQNDLILQMKNL